MSPVFASSCAERTVDYTGTTFDVQVGLNDMLLERTMLGRVTWKCRAVRET